MRIRIRIESGDFLLRLIQVFILVFASFWWVGCQTPPTKIIEKKPALRPQRPDIQEPLKITEKTVVIDARDAFAYATAHISRSVHLDWREFSQKEAPFQGLLNNDLYFYSRRLARLGIGLDSEVIVVGSGVSGSGEAGRLAWTLYYMGIQNVRYASDNYFKIGWTNTETEGRYESVPSWKPQLNESILAGKQEVLATLKGGSTVLLDVRSQQEYLSRQSESSSVKLPELREINIDWREFLTEKGLPQREIVKKLSAIGLNKDQRIITISNNGVRSAAVTMALLDLGFWNAANYAGGYSELMSR